MSMSDQTTKEQPYKPRIRHVSGTRYDVQSRTRPERTHHCDVYHLTCNCEAGQRGKRCWALALAVSYDAWRRQEGKQARQAERAAQQAGNWSSAPAPATKSAQEGAPAMGSVAVPLQQTGDLLPLSRWFE